MAFLTFNKIRTGAAAAGLAALAACATPAPPPPPPPAVVQIPYRPVPPGGAAPQMVIPPVGADGVRQTVNANISTAQRTWNLRSAYVVASLNCLGAEYTPILEGYKRFLDMHGRDLGKVNAAVEREWKDRHGNGYKRARDSYTTQVYNYFALPPALPQFCNAALKMSEESLSVAPGQLDAFAFTALSGLEAVFDQFYRDFDQYRVELAQWDAQYGAQYGPARSSQTGQLSAGYPAVSGQQ